MKITALDILHADGGWRTLSFLKVSTDEGLVGWSEFYEGFGVGGTSDLIRRFTGSVLGRDPRDVAPLSAMLHAISRLNPGGIAHQAIAAIENACLDIKARALGVPVYALFGGAHRDTIPLYWTHCGYFRATRPELFEERLGLSGIRSLDDVKALGADVAARGFSALKTNPLIFTNGQARAFDPGFSPLPSSVARDLPPDLVPATRDLIEAFRDGAGEDVAIHLDLNFTLRPDGYRAVLGALADAGLAWVEIDHPDPRALAALRQGSVAPVASLEAIYGGRAYLDFLREDAVDVAIIDVIWNGVLESVRIATIADAFDVAIAPHNFYGELGTAISAHLCAAVPNARTMEFEVDDAPWRAEFVHAPLEIRDGQLVLPTGPGWGVDPDENAIRERAAQP